VILTSITSTLEQFKPAMYLLLKFILCILKLVRSSTDSFYRSIQQNEEIDCIRVYSPRYRHCTVDRFSRIGYHILRAKYSMYVSML